MENRPTKASLAKWREAHSSGSKGFTRCGQKVFRWGEKTYVMGIINVSPDSFSGDGLASIDDAVAQAQRFAAEGADIIDIGGESTRPGTAPQSEKETINRELDRVMPVLQKLAGKIDIPISIDTYHYEVAKSALDAGARMINDIWGLKREPELAKLAAERNVPILLMANHRNAPQRSIMPSIIANLKWSIDTALKAGVPWDNIIIDPGIGFGPTYEQNLEILRRFNELKVLGRPLLLATSRKSVIGLTLNLPPDQRLEGTAATVAIGIAKGADMVRVHDVSQMIRVCRMSDAIIRGTAQRQT
jgi:dihydropteroate synthase